MELPKGTRGIGGSYADVLDGLSGWKTPDQADVGVIVARKNEPAFEDFLVDLGRFSPARTYVGGVAAYPMGTGEGELTFQSDSVEVLLLLSSGRTRTCTIHEAYRRDVPVEADGRVLISIDGQNPLDVLRRTAAEAGILFDMEHVTISDAYGRNIHLTETNGILHSGARIPEDRAHIRVAPSIVSGLGRILGGHRLAFSCAGLAGAVEQPFEPAMGITAWMFGEVVDSGAGPRLGNLMTSVWR